MQSPGSVGALRPVPSIHPRPKHTGNGRHPTPERTGIPGRNNHDEHRVGDIGRSSLKKNGIAFTTKWGDGLRGTVVRHQQRQAFRVGCSRGIDPQSRVRILRSIFYSQEETRAASVQRRTRPPTLFRHSVFGTRGVDEFDSNDTFETSNRTIREVRDLQDEDDGLLLN